MKQYTDNEGFDALGLCIADIQTGDLNEKAKLEGADSNAWETDYDVTEEDLLGGVDSDNWIEAELEPAYAGDVSTTDHTQFRLYSAMSMAR